MREIGKILTYLVGVVILGALLAPPLYWGAQALIDAGYLRSLAKFRFDKYLNRAILVSALVLLWPFIRSLKLKSRADLGIVPNPLWKKDLLGGFLLGFVGLTLVAGVLILAGDVQFRSAPKLSVWLAAVAAAVVVPILEEGLFRGVLFGVLRRHLSWQRALIFLSILFAALHFVRAKKGVTKGLDVDWLSGFAILPHSFWKFARPDLLLGGLLTLFLVGWVLGYAVLKTRSLFLSIGLHGGWILALKIFTLMTRGRKTGSFWVGKDLITGALPVLLMLLTLALLIFLLRSRSFGSDKEGLNSTLYTGDKLPDMHE
ncbi:CPBP family intramembrane metalloprotease [Myxococcota bacterium]|nr:CPBP family intramembrane metalloprotease [Myxococcota bacterium]